VFKELQRQAAFRAVYEFSDNFLDIISAAGIILITMFNIIAIERTERENKKPVFAGPNEKFVTSPSPVNSGLGPGKNNSCQAVTPTTASAHDVKT